MEWLCGSSILQKSGQSVSIPSTIHSTYRLQRSSTTIVTSNNHIAPVKGNQTCRRQPNLYTFLPPAPSKATYLYIVNHDSVCILRTTLSSIIQPQKIPNHLLHDGGLRVPSTFIDGFGLLIAVVVVVYSWRVWLHAGDSYSPMDTTLICDKDKSVQALPICVLGDSSTGIELVRTINIYFYRTSSGWSSFCV